jgi:hypothetical protein
MLALESGSDLHAHHQRACLFVDVFGHELPMAIGHHVLQFQRLQVHLQIA